LSNVALACVDAIAGGGVVRTGAVVCTRVVGVVVGRDVAVCLAAWASVRTAVDDGWAARMTPIHSANEPHAVVSFDVGFDTR
jgi:hypothetical protein